MDVSMDASMTTVRITARRRIGRDTHVSAVREWVE
jgi:hypothetical protein